MNTYDINRNYHILKPLIDKAILDSVEWITKRCKPHKPQEPDYVAALLNKFLKDFFNILVAVFPEYDFSVSSIYCHQSPIVDIGGTKNPEIGDILFVYIDRKNGDKDILNSLLLQAKISNNPVLKIPSREKHQLELYKYWPAFIYKSGLLRGKERDIYPKSITDGAQYLLIDDNPMTNGMYDKIRMFPMGCAIPDDVLCINNSLTEELIDMLKFKTGRVFDGEEYETIDDWSKMIWDLLKSAALKYSKRKYAGLDKFSRGQIYNHYFTEHMVGATLWEKICGHRNSEKWIHEEDIGVSVVLIESQLKRRPDE